jgi:hypothetical protein
VINMKTAKALGLVVSKSMQFARRRGDGIATLLLQCMSPVLAQSRLLDAIDQCSL